VPESIELKKEYRLGPIRPIRCIHCKKKTFLTRFPDFFIYMYNSRLDTKRYLKNFSIPMKKYDLITIFKNSGELEEAKKALKDILQRNNVEVLNEEDWGTRTLYYEMNHNRTGWYHYISCQLDQAKVKEVSRELNIHSEVLKHMFRSVA
jgi:small subunit ribosomal protein S6